jgi:acid phosphatase type 7
MAYDALQMKPPVIIAVMSAVVLVSSFGCDQQDVGNSPSGSTDQTATSPTESRELPTTTSSSGPVLVGAGDIASGANQNDEATAKLLDGISGTVFTMGDNAYSSGTSTEFSNYYNPTWGRHKARTKPSVGNHEYLTPGASGYFNYFGSAAGTPSKGYYSYNLGAWHIVVLNSMCEKVGGCGATSAMVSWLKQDLAANTTTCTLSYWHHPVFSSGAEHGNDPKMKPSWDALYAAGAEVIVNGHDHDYERFAPQSPSGASDNARGIREFVVGTGGRSLRPFGTIQPNSQVRNAATNGVLKLNLNSNSYDWKFVPVAGQSFTDSGSTSCH